MRCNPGWSQRSEATKWIVSRANLNGLGRRVESSRDKAPDEVDSEAVW